MFGTALNYTALRILGVDKDHPVCVRARGKLHELGMYHSSKSIWDDRSPFFVWRTLDATSVSECSETMIMLSRAT